MCGIVAIVGKTPGKGVIEASLETLSHRGPDDRGILNFSQCTLAQSRLAIIDLSADGHQPIRDNDHDIAITFNGEIYNYKELRAGLEEKGYRFSTHTDTEVILKAYLEYGDECPERLDGMFAFVIWDNEQQRAFMARDRFGKKPLYYHINNEGTLTAASEMKALFAMGIRGILDPAGIDAYLALMYVPPWRTIYKNIHVLLPAHSATFKDGEFSAVRYWHLERTPIHPSYDEAKEEVRRLFTDAVRKRMLAADVEVGAFLSGGVDSTLTTAYAQKFIDHPIKTFSLGYGDHINELPYAGKASNQIGTEHYTLQATSNLTDEIEKVMMYFDEPHGDSSDFPQHMVSELASEYVKVALTGDGADELFLGYGWHWQFWHRPKLAQLRNFLTHATPYSEHIRTITQFPTRLRRQLFKEQSVAGSEDIEHLVRSTPGNGIEKINEFDISTYLPGQLLVKADQMSMMHSLEVRSPFLDYKLAEYVVSLPLEFKTNRSTGKLILKDLLAEIMPREFVDRKKQGFGAPVRKWLQEPSLRTYVAKMFGPDARVYTFMREDRVQKFIKHAYKSSTNPKPYYQLWVLLMLEVWLRQHEKTYDF